ncbi:MAG: hypothetical protein HYT87_08685 [Nitrospirae bacterium]|nr:hypothetical protein [Nitrospirota bacterium]
MPFWCRFGTLTTVVLALVGTHVGPAAAQEPRTKSVGTARFLGIGSTLIVGGGGAGLYFFGKSQDNANAQAMGTVLGAAGLGVAPSMGHVYCEEYEHAFLFSMFRFLAMGVAAGAAAGAKDEDRSLRPGESMAILLGGVGWTALTIYDWFDIDDAVRRYSEGPPDRREEYGLRLAPLMTRDTYGAVLRIEF